MTPSCLEPDGESSGMRGARPSLPLAVVPVTMPGTRRGLGGSLEGGGDSRGAVHGAEEN